MAAAANATVFPGQPYCPGQLGRADRPLLSGGNLSKADKDAAAAFKPSDSDMTALRICALREAFEEIGILVKNPKSRSRLSKEALSQWRKRVYSQPDLFLDLYREAGESSMPSLESLV